MTKIAAKRNERTAAAFAEVVVLAEGGSGSLWILENSGIPCYRTLFIDPCHHGLAKGIDRVLRAQSGGWRRRITIDQEVIAMYNIDALVRGRRSFRTYDERPLSQQDLDKLRAFMEQIDNPYGLPVEFRLLDAREQNLSCPVVVGTDLYVGAKMKKTPHLNEAIGYSFEKLVLYAQSLGIGTVWVGGTMDRAAFERAVQLTEDEVMPCVSPLGYPAKKMSLRETMMRKGVKADDRMAFEELFFDGSFDVPLTQQRAGKLAHALEMVRLGPSAVNKQPWRVVLAENAAHFYLKRSKGFNGGMLDMQKIDVGIALCHFDLAAREAGFTPCFEQADPGISVRDGEEYIASYGY